MHFPGFQEPSIVAIVEVDRLRWAGHVARMNASPTLVTMFENDPDGCRGVPKRGGSTKR